MNIANECEQGIDKLLKDMNCRIVLRLLINHNGIEIDATDELIKQFNIVPKIIVVEMNQTKEGE